MSNQWSESDYQKAGYVTVKLRLKKEVGEALAALVEGSNLGRVDVISSLIIGKAKALARRRKTASKP